MIDCFRERMAAAQCCFLCPETRKMRNKLENLHQWSVNPQSRPPVDAAFEDREVCQVVTPHGRRPYTVREAKQQYAQDHPDWATSLTRHPHGPLYFDKMVERMQRAMDLEKKRPMTPKDHAHYVNRVGAMGESVATEALSRELEGRTAFLIQGFKFRNYIEGGKKARVTTLPSPTNLCIPPLQDAAGQLTDLGGTEHDLMAALPSGERLQVILGQVKALEKDDDNSIRTVVGKAFGQLVKDVEGFLKIFPELDALAASKMSFRPLAILPSTRKKPSVCPTCCDYVVFREELTPGAVDQASWAEDLYQDLMAQATIISRPSLAQKAGLVNIVPPTKEGLNLCLSISARYAGISSLFPMKKYSTFLSKLIGQLQRMDSQVVPRSLKRALDSRSECEALRLTTEQVAAVNSGSAMITGMFGSGKTTVRSQPCKPTNLTISGSDLHRPQDPRRRPRHPDVPGLLG